MSASEGQVADCRASAVKNMQAAAAGENLSVVANARRAAGAAASVAARRRVHGDPRTLYGRGGGLFGLAKLSDRLMDVWMENHLLNANQSVAKWHESQQKFGFKFLVTQLLGYLTGGPQRYTGQSMEAAHKHLGISMAEWSCFVADAERVFREFNLEHSVHKELLQIIQGFKEQCTVRPGEAAPKDPGLCRKRPDGSTAYANLGGIYPIALYADRLVEAVLCGPGALRVRWDASGTRTPAALKYLVTELLANATGGPEIVTAKDFEEAKLGIEVEQWDDFLALAKEIAMVWPTPHHRELIVKTIMAKKTDLCVGLVDESGVSDARRQLSESGYGVIEQAAALDTCNGDAVRALEMLRSGWTPESQIRRSNSGSTLASMDTDYSRRTDIRTSFCPFNGSMTDSAQVSGCPFLQATRGSQPMAGQVAHSTTDVDQPLHTTIQVLSECGKPKAEISQMLGINEAAVDAALSQDRYAIAAKFLAKKKISFQTITQILNMSEARVHGAIYNEGPGKVALAGRVLGNSLQKRLDELCDEDSEMCCPVTLMLFRDPVIASDGFMYEADSVKQLIRTHQNSPITRENLKKEYYQAKQKKSEVLAFREKRAQALLQFSEETLSSEPRMTCMAMDRVVEYLEALGASQHPALAKQAAVLWEKTGRPLPDELLLYL